MLDDVDYNIDRDVDGTYYCKDSGICNEDDDYSVSAKRNGTAKTSNMMVEDVVLDEAVDWILSLVSDTLVIFDPSLY